MRNRLKVIVALLIIMSTIISPVTAMRPTQENCNGGITGAVWATLGNYDRNTEIFYIGEDVYITGANIAKQNVGPLTGSVDWQVILPDEFGKPVIASGTASLTDVNPYAILYPNANPAFITPIKILTIDQNLVGKKLRLDVSESGIIGGCNFEFSAKDSFGAAIPEFPTVALPVAAVIGLVFFFQHRKKKEE